LFKCNIINIKLYFIITSEISMSKKEIQDKELKSVMAKDIGAKNAIFSPDAIA